MRSVENEMRYEDAVESRTPGHMCGEDDGKWAQCEETINLALAARTRLWDGIAGKIRERSG